MSKGVNEVEITPIESNDEVRPLIQEEIDSTSYNQADLNQYPKAVYFIVGNEFCERFSFYGMKTVLYRYLSKDGYLGFTEHDATAVVHSFVMLAYAFPLLGAVLSDSYIGRYKTIFYLSIVYCIGNLVLAFTAIPYVTGNPPSAWGCFLGLFLLALGTGGIKPCVSAFGADQFHLSQTRQIQLFFSMFYFSINAGSVLSTIITPELRSIACLGLDSCYPLAFGIPAILMIVATIIFVLGSKVYIHTPLKSNIFVEVYMIITSALKQPSSDVHWLERVEPVYGKEKVKEVKQLLNVLFMFLPLPIFWTLFDQQSSRWVWQAGLMKTEYTWFGSKFKVKPDQMQFANALFILIMIPIFEQFIYPSVAKLGVNLSSIRRMVLGMCITGLSFLVAALLQTAINYQPAKTVSVFWQLPQYGIITAGEVMFSITGLEFAYSQAPKSMKSICQAAWLLTVAFGNLVVVIVAESQLFDIVYELYFFSVLIFVAAIVFGIMGYYYRPVEIESDVVNERDNDEEEVSQIQDEQEAMLEEESSKNK